MQTQWSLVDRSRPKRSNEEYTGLCSKRQRRLGSDLESSDECEDVAQIRGGSARPRPPSLGPPPNRATNPAPQPTTTTPSNTAAPAQAPQSKISIVEDDDDDEDWLARGNRPASTTQPGTTGAVNATTTGVSSTSAPPKLQNPPPQVSNTTAQPPKVQIQSQPPAQTGSRPPGSGQTTVTGSVASTGSPAGTPSTTATTTGPAPLPVPANPLPPFPRESDILQLYSRLQDMILIWVEECLPDTFPPEFQTARPERYWELCGWCKPMTLGNTMLGSRSWAKYVYESWVWRFLHQMVLYHESLAWAGYDLPNERGGAAGLGKSTNDQFGSIFNTKQRAISPHMYRNRIQIRATVMAQVRNGLVTQDRKQLVSQRLVKEMLVAFYPYFSDAYNPITHPENIEVLIRDTRFLIDRALELDHQLRSARNVYDLILGREGDVCRISDVPSPAIQRYVVAGNHTGAPDNLDDHSLIGLIVVPGLVRLELEESMFGDGDALTKTVVRSARAFAQSDLSAVYSST